MEYVIISVSHFHEPAAITKLKWRCKMTILYDIIANIIVILHIVIKFIVYLGLVVHVSSVHLFSWYLDTEGDHKKHAATNAKRNEDNY